MSAATPMARVARVLVVDDEQPIRDLLHGYLAREQLEVLTAADGSTAMELLRREQPDVVVLDLMLPGLDGIEVCRQLRTFSDAYVLMLTARGEELDRLVGLGVGADDYMVKPFSPRELVARVRALLRRPRRGIAAVAAGLTVDPARRQVSVDGRPVPLTVIEFDLLAGLAREPGVVRTRSELFSAVWGENIMGDDHVLDVHIAKLRRKLGDVRGQRRFIETVRGIGFRLVDR